MSDGVPKLSVAQTLSEKIVALTPGGLPERQPYLRGGAQEPLRRQDVVDKFLLNAEYGGWTKAQADAALQLMAGLNHGRIDLSSLRG